MQTFTAWFVKTAVIAGGVFVATASLRSAVDVSGHALAPASPAAFSQPRVTNVDDPVVDSLLARMTVREKVAQMVMAWIPGALEPRSREFRRVEQLVATQRVGGVIVGKGDRAATIRSIRALQARSRVPLLVASDLEWGAGMRLLGATLLPPAMAVTAAGDTTLAYEHGRVTASEARPSGFNMTLSPVLDVNIDPRNPIINVRSFGEDPRDVARFAAAVTRGLQDGGLIAVGKHFPGHGDTHEDSHLALPTITGSRARLDSVELVPFRAAIEAGIGGIMVGHLSAPALGTGRLPSSLSRDVATTLLRDRLGFDGLVFTDALNMAGATRGRTSAQLALQAVSAGADILLQPTMPEAVIDAISGAVSRGEITRARLDSSVRRILRAKARVGLIGLTATRQRASSASGTPAAAVVADSIAARSITLVRDEEGLLPARAERPIVSLTYASGVGVPGGPNEAFDATLRAGGMRVTRLTLTARNARAIADSLSRGSDGGSTAPLVIVSAYMLPIPGRAPSIPRSVAESVERLATRSSLVFVAFGAPYAAAHVPSASTVVVAWTGIPAAQRAAARVILGARPATGRLPVSIPPG